eukprot:156018-Hanusia_phi.AAC.1
MNWLNQVHPPYRTEDSWRKHYTVAHSMGREMTQYITVPEIEQALIIPGPDTCPALSPRSLGGTQCSARPPAVSACRCSDLL